MRSAWQSIFPDVQTDVQGVIVLGTEALRDENTGTHGNALEETDHHVDQAGRRTDSGQCSVTQIVAHDPGVESVVKLLKHVAQENGKGEQQNLGPDGTFGKVLLGGVSFGLMIMKPVTTEWHAGHFLNIIYWFSYTL